MEFYRNDVENEQFKLNSPGDTTKSYLQAQLFFSPDLIK